MTKVDLEAIIEKNGYLEHQRIEPGQADFLHNLKENSSDYSYAYAPVKYTWLKISENERDLLVLGEFPKRFLFKVKTKDLLKENGNNEQAYFVASLRKMTDPYKRPGVNGVVLVCGEKDYNKILDMLHADKSSSKYIAATLDNILYKRKTFNKYNKMPAPKELGLIENFSFAVN